MHYVPLSGTSSQCNPLFLNPGIYGLVQAIAGVGTVCVWYFCVGITRERGVCVFEWAQCSSPWEAAVLTSVSPPQVPPTAALRSCESGFNLHPAVLPYATDVRCGHPPHFTSMGVAACEASAGTGSILDATGAVYCDGAQWGSSHLHLTLCCLFQPPVFVPRAHWEAHRRYSHCVTWFQTQVILTMCQGEYQTRCMRGAGTGVVPSTLSSRANQGEW